ncbi:MAG: HAD family hydrolase [Anaerolineae bacterium]
MKADPRLEKLDALIFDIDGVLIDVSRSYREAVRQTVQLYLERGLGLTAGSRPLLTADEVEMLKLAGGFNNDWDLTTAFIAYFLEMLPPVSTPTFSLRRDVPSMLAYLQTAAYHLKTTIDQLREWKNIPRLADQVEKAGGGLSGLKAALNPQNSHLLLARGTVKNGNLVQRIFQELYLGANLFEQTYNEPAVVIQTTGHIENERLIMDFVLLRNLSAKLKLGVATGRPRAEAEHALQSRNIRHHFQTVVSLDDVLEANAMSKPAPWSLLEAANRLQPPPRFSAYVGDTPDDMRAARAANLILPFIAIGCLPTASDKAAVRRALEAHRADVILDHPNDLGRLLLG